MVALAVFRVCWDSQAHNTGNVLPKVDEEPNRLGGRWWHGALVWWRRCVEYGDERRPERHEFNHSRACLLS